MSFTGGATPDCVSSSLSSLTSPRFLLLECSSGGPTYKENGNTLNPDKISLEKCMILGLKQQATAS